MIRWTTAIPALASLMALMLTCVAPIQAPGRQKDHAHAHGHHHHHHHHHGPSHAHVHVRHIEPIRADREHPLEAEPVHPSEPDTGHHCCGFCQSGGHAPAWAEAASSVRNAPTVIAAALPPTATGAGVVAPKPRWRPPPRAGPDHRRTALRTIRLLT